LKAKDLVKLIQALDPDKEIYMCTCSSSCMGSTTKDIELEDRNHTTWDHKTKSVAHNVITELIGIDN
jgi:hypothetical protein